MYGCMFQALEHRVLFAGVVADGVLTVTGTTANDTISVSVDPDAPGGDAIVVTLNDVEENFDLFSVTRVVIIGREGNDDIDCDEGEPSPLL